MIKVDCSPSSMRIEVTPPNDATKIYLEHLKQYPGNRKHHSFHYSFCIKVNSYTRQKLISDSRYKTSQFLKRVNFEKNAKISTMFTISKFENDQKYVQEFKKFL